MGTLVQKVIDVADNAAPITVPVATIVADRLNKWFNPPKYWSGFGGGDFGGAGASGDWDFVEAVTPFPNGRWCLSIDCTDKRFPPKYYYRSSTGGCGGICSTVDPPTGYVQHLRTHNSLWVIGKPPQKGGACASTAWEYRPHARYVRCPSVPLGTVIPVGHVLPVNRVDGTIAREEPRAPRRASKPDRPEESPGDDLPRQEEEEEWPVPIILAVTAGIPPGAYVPPPRPTPRQPPKARQKEPPKHSTRAARVARAIFKGLDRVSEAAEVADCAFEALPKDVQKRWKKGRPKRGLLDNAGQYGIDGADWKLQAVWHNSHKLDVKAMLRCIVRNEIQDDILGRMYRGVERAFPGGRIMPGHAIDDGAKAVNKLIEAALDGLGM